MWHGLFCDELEAFVGSKSLAAFPTILLFTTKRLAVVEHLTRKLWTKIWGTWGRAEAGPEVLTKNECKKELSQKKKIMKISNKRRYRFPPNQSALMSILKLRGHSETMKNFPDTAFLDTKNSHGSLEQLASFVPANDQFVNKTPCFICARMWIIFF